MLMAKQGMRELKQPVHPQAIIPPKVCDSRVPATVVSAVWRFFAFYTSTFIRLLVLMLAGQDFITGFSDVTASLNNMGLGLRGA